MVIALILGSAIHPIAAENTHDLVNGPSDIHVKPFVLPPSYFLDQKSRNTIQSAKSSWAESCPDLARAAIQTIRECQSKHYFAPLLQRFAKRYPTLVRTRRVAGVDVAEVVPAVGVDKRQELRILINLHGGSFTYGGQYGGQVEGIPISAVGRMRVIGVDYRLAPEYRFPSALEDAVAVYKELTKTYRPERIGIYGCSAGAILAAQTLARLHQERVPLPGAVAMLGGGPYPFNGDSYFIAQALAGYEWRPVDLYGQVPDLSDPAFFPGNSPEVLARFPPTLLISSTRDIALSAVIKTHVELTKLGVDADLRVWEGVDHCFHFDPDLDASREAYNAIAKFFDSRLAE